MATYRSIAATETDPQAPLTAALMKALEANPTAITEGASGAPRIQFAAMDTWFRTAGDVGTYVLAKRGTGTADIAYGTNVAGSALVPTSAVTVISNLTGVMTMDSGAALSGTWKCMGTLDTSSPGSAGFAIGATLWMRVA